METTAKKITRGPFINRDNLKIHEVPNIQVFVTKSVGTATENGFPWVEIDPRILNQNLLTRFDEEGWEVNITGENTYEFIRQYRFHNERNLESAYRYKIILPDDTWIRLPDDNLSDLITDYFNTINMHLNEVINLELNDGMQAIFNEFQDLESPRVPELKELFEQFEDFQVCHMRIKDSARELKNLLHKFGVKRELF